MKRTAEEVLEGWWCEDQMDLLNPELTRPVPPPPRKPPKPPRPRNPSPSSWTCPQQMEIE